MTKEIDPKPQEVELFSPTLFPLGRGHYKPKGTEGTCMQTPHRSYPNHPQPVHPLTKKKTIKHQTN